MNDSLQIDFFNDISQCNIQNVKTHYLNSAYEAYEFSDREDFSGLHRSIYNDSTQLSLLIIQCLRERLDNKALKSYLNRRGALGLTPLHQAAFRGNLEIVQTLLKNGADFNIVSTNGLTALHIACQTDQINIAVYLVEKIGIDPNSKDNTGSTPLHWACFMASDQCVSYLITKVSDINLRDHDGSTFLLLACSSGRVKIVKMILLQGARIDLRDNSGKSALECARAKGFRVIVELLEESSYSCFLMNYICPAMNKMKNSKGNVIIFILLHIVFEFNLFCFILPHLQHTNLKTYSSVVLLLIIYTFGILANSDSVNKSERSKRRVNLLQMIENDEIISNVCFKCISRMDSETRHCVICDKCILDFDHHCFWVNNCIGKENQIYFLSFLVLIIGNLALNLIASVKAMVSLEYDYGNALLHENGFERFLFSINGRKVISIIQFFICFVFLFPVFALLCLHLRNKYFYRSPNYKQYYTTEDSRNEYLLNR